MADASIGEVEITLDGKTATLRCSLAAAKRVNTLANGHVGVIARLGTMDFDAYVQVVAAGLDKKPVDIETKVYRTGMPALTGDLVTWITYLANGGRPITAAVEKDGDESGEA